jgi:hypothetical protein
MSKSVVVKNRKSTKKGSGNLMNDDYVHFIMKENERKEKEFKQKVSNDTTVIYNQVAAAQ